MGKTGLTPWEIIAPLFGAGGLTTIIVAVFAYLKASREGGRGQPERAAATVGISALLADSDSVTKLALSLAQLALASDKIALLTEESREETKDGLERLQKTGKDLVEELRQLRHVIEDQLRRRD